MRDERPDTAAPTHDVHLLSAILRNVVDGIITITESGVVTTFNPAAERIFGYRAEEVVGNDVAMLMSDRDREQHGRYLERLRTSGRNPAVGRGRELAGRRRDGTLFQLELAVGAIDDDAGVRYVGIIRDVSDHKAAEHERGLNHAMLSTISAVQSEFIIDGDPQRAFDALLQQFLDLSGSEYGFIGEVLRSDDGSPYLKTHAITNIAWNAQTRAFYERNAPTGLEFSNLATLFGEVIRTERAVVANEPVSDPRAGGLPPGHPALDAFLGIPFFMGARMVGMVGIANRPGGYDDDVIELLTPLTQTCANLVGAIDAKRERQLAEEALRKANERLNATVEAMRIQNERMRLLSDLEDLLQSCESREEAAGVLSHLAVRMFRGWSGALYVLEQHHQLLEPAAQWGAMAATAELSARECIAMRRSRPHRSAGAAGPLNCAHVDIERGIGICVPLVGKSEAFGLFHLAADASTTDLGDIAGVEELAGTTGRRVAVTLANLRLSESLREQSVRDPLTQLFNRRYMVDTLQRELRRRERDPGFVTSVVVLDLDHFKTVNDRYGHATGDLVLAEVAEVLRSVVRPSDVVCRMGGEEFVLVLPGCDSTVAVKRCEDALVAVRELVVEHEGDAIGPVTISAGVACHPRHGSTPNELIAAADAALYEAKAAGRDRFVLA